jgi:hypothetical protein
VTANDIFGRDTNYVRARIINTGCADNAYGTNLSVSRAEMAGFLVQGHPAIRPVTGALGARAGAP